MKSDPERILVTRTDRLGDVILATPVLRELKKRYPQAKISFLVQKSWMPILHFGQEIELITYDPSTDVLTLAALLKTKKFDRAYVLRDEKIVTLAVKKAAIPERVGPYSSLRSFFAFNFGRFQKRSRCRLHEAEYNLDLVHPQFPAEKPEALPQAWVATSAEAKVRADDFLTTQVLVSQKFIVIHPGASGSARYVKTQALHELAKKLLARGFEVCVSGGPLEQDLIRAFQAVVPEVKLLGLDTELGLDGMAEVYRQAQAVIAHGTGPLHLAAAVGTPTLAIFPPIFVLSEKRWGPLIAKRAVWVPGVACPAKFRCLGPRCGYYDCMDLFESEVALKMLEKIIS